MIVSWHWLSQYVQLDMSVEQLASRLMMAGLNHESTQRVGDDWAIDLEVTSNRPDCLGHIGIAREVAVLWDRPLKVPSPQPPTAATPVAELTSVALQAEELCPRYTARVIRGAKVGPSPDWLVKHLTTIDPGYKPVNNVVDITNYVLFECGQPLHAFDFARLAGRKIIVREARRGEKFEAINHKLYELEPGMCVIADAERPVALGGVMGGADTEVSEATRDVLIEAAEFNPLSVRTTARKLTLDSPSSYRFERGVDPAGVDWASRRCCELILDTAGGELAEGVIDVGRPPQRPQPIVLRFSQLERILGIEIPPAEVRKILVALGVEEVAASAERVEVIPPSWRRDLTREVDLVEEAGRIHGYENIPEDVGVPMVASKRSDEDRIIGRVRQVLTALGFNEALTLSAVERDWSAAFSPWTDAAALATLTPVLRRADQLRRSLVPSLLGARRYNESLANGDIELFEIAKIYLPRTGELPEEPRMLGITSGRGFLPVKGVLEAIVEAANPELRLEVVDAEQPLFERGRAVELRLAGERFGFLGDVSGEGLKRFELRSPATVAEVRLPVLFEHARLVAKQRPLSAYPAVTRDLNLVVAEAVRWADVEQIVRREGGELLELLEYQDTWRDDKRLGAGRKSLLFRLTLRSQSETLTSEQADALRDRIVAQLAKELGGELRA